MSDALKLAQLHLQKLPCEARTVDELQAYYKRLGATGISTSTLAALIADEEFAELVRSSTKMASEAIARAMRR